MRNGVAALFFEYVSDISRRIITRGCDIVERNIESIIFRYKINDFFIYRGNVKTRFVFFNLKIQQLEHTAERLYKCFYIIFRRDILFEPIITFQQRLGIFAVMFRDFRYMVKNTRRRFCVSRDADKAKGSFFVEYGEYEFMYPRPAHSAKEAAATMILDGKLLFNTFLMRGGGKFDRHAVFVFVPVKRKEFGYVLYKVILIVDKADFQRKAFQISDIIDDIFY